ncbi:class I SAM-dependent methyltransferase [Calditerrivibrio nitroreducens]|uniref:Methyltransferase type 11 n=1 Tax=Calditerrivibrio nitroreducens (strain DSM 19672 / NBRC 101217 / Yu37-1) TaxID=768670 RepID=E4TK29_CALNY|nr:class I SAM-dependent methyltransferase [Calditerrivibrio nitroreducens]ADR19305.1 Methyltransferase type 11 [Calditerrivibrio nitroreducens DSM 19672]
MTKSKSSDGFDKSFTNYLISSDHKYGDDLEIVKNYFNNIVFETILDVATGAGHFTNVFNAKRKCAVDLSFNMVKTAKEKYHIDFAAVCDSAGLPFFEQSFDLVSCRIAFHHFSRPILFFDEVYRILKKSGYFVLVDSIVDVDDAYLNTIEYIRDNSHIRSYTVKEIINFCSNFFRLEYFRNIYKKHNFKEWAGRLGADEKDIKCIENSFLELPDEIKYELNLEIVENSIYSYTDKKGVFIFKSL